MNSFQRHLSLSLSGNSSKTSSKKYSILNCYLYSEIDIKEGILAIRIIKNDKLSVNKIILERHLNEK